ncbi:MAG TPA: hypothetical protein VNI01_09190 [Elusimicrobiota bacterium]|jgi:DNA-directed RNA polymerase subunit N (RpoN/RPB10)|nr:hypothetical protein [Elusimicrobiota bacterium]
MLTPVVCFTCGMPTGDVAALFRSLRALMVEKALAALGTLIDFAPVDPGLQLDCDAIFEALGVGRERECCRKVLATAKIFTDSY